MNELIILAEKERDGLIPIRVDTFAQLRNTFPEVSGQPAILLGGGAIGDVNGGTFRYDASDTTTLDDNLNTIVTTEGQRWKRVRLAYASQAQGAKADTALQPGDNISELANNSGYITASQAPVQSVNGETGDVSLDAPDVGADPAGSAANALTSANTYTDNAIASLGALATENTISSSSQIDNDVVEETNLSVAVRQKLNRTAPNNFSATADPTVDDDSTEGWEVGSVWINTTSVPPEAFRCLDASEGAAVWVNTTLSTDELADVAVSGSYNDLLDLPTLGTAAARDIGTSPTQIPLNSDLGSAAYEDSGAFATAAQGTLAENALPSADVVTDENGFIRSASASNDTAPIEITANTTAPVTWRRQDIRADSTSGAIVITLPEDATTPSIGVGFEFNVQRAGVNDVSFEGEVGVTLEVEGSPPTAQIANQFGWVTVKKMAANTWAIVGGIDL